MSNDNESKKDSVQEKTDGPEVVAERLSKVNLNAAATINAQQEPPKGASPDSINKLKRFLYINGYNAVHYTGDPDKTFAQLNHSVACSMAKDAPGDFIQILCAANADKLLPRRKNLFYVLAVVLSQCEDIKSECRTLIKNLVLDFIQDDYEFFDFIRYHTTLRKDNGKPKFSTTLRKIIVKFYDGKTPLELAESVTRFIGMHTWTHRDLFKLIHFNSKSIAATVVIDYVMKGPHIIPESFEKDHPEVYQQLTKSHKLRTGVDPKEASALATELKAYITQVNSKLNNNTDVWTAVIPFMPVRKVLHLLTKFFRLNILTGDNPAKKAILNVLSDTQKISSEQLHPLEVFIYLRNFQKGGPPLDPKLIEHLKKRHAQSEDDLKAATRRIQPTCKDVMRVVNNCLKTSYDNLKKIGKNFLITIDITDLEGPCFHNRNILYYEAIFSIIQWFQTMKENFTVGYFNNNDITLLDQHKWRTSTLFLEKIKSIDQPSHILPCAPFKWAQNKKKKFDVFINFTNTNWYLKLPAELKPTCQANNTSLKHYCDAMKLPDTKLVKMFLDGRIIGKYEEETKNVLSIAGLDPGVPRILEAFCRGSFH